MRRIENPLTTEGKNSTKKNSRRGKSFGYQVLGFGSGGKGPTPFIEATGGTIITCGNYKTHVFTGDGTFTVCSVGCAAGSTTVDYLVVAGGGAGGPNSTRGGGGGAVEPLPPA